MPVNFVFVGYEPSAADLAAFRAKLPERYEAIIRSRLWYPDDPNENFLGLGYTYDYNIFNTDAAFETRFFDHLASIAVPEATVDGREITLFQAQYNAQQNNVLDVRNNYFIDAPSVEQWLAANAPAGVDTARNTVFFVNWWGRPGFRFHTYTKIGEPDPDTGYDFGLERQSRKIIAWGGTPPGGADGDEETGLSDVRRIWFYDLSAGPESWSDNWNVDNADVDGDGELDYRLPLVWEYGNTAGYRPFTDLYGDLGKVARYGAVNLLFTPSPLYPPMITPPRQPDTVTAPAAINLDLNTYEGWDGVDASEQFQTPELLLDETQEVHRVPYNLDQQDFAFTKEAKVCYYQWIHEVQCNNQYRQYPGFANLFVYSALNQVFWRDNIAPAEYEAPFFNYAVDQAPKEAGFLGFADDNWIDGTQSGTFNFISPGVVAAGYGLTTTQIHEYGHHFGMSHPHDGYDFEDGVDYTGAGEHYFVWTTDEVNSMMSYIDLNWDYSQFDRDNANRFQAAAYWVNVNTIAGLIGGSRNSGAGAAGLASADSLLGAAQTALAAHDYIAAFDNARAAYLAARRAYTAAFGTDVPASNNGWTLLPPQKHGKGKVKREYAYQDKIGPGLKRSAP